MEQAATGQGQARDDGETDDVWLSQTVAALFGTNLAAWCGKNVLELFVLQRGRLFSSVYWVHPAH